MSDEIKEVSFTLKHPFDYAVKGDMRTAQFINLIPPTFKQMGNFIPIKQAFVKAVNDVKTNATDAEISDATERAGDDDITGPGVIVLMYQSGVDMTKVFLYAEQLFKSGAALVEGEEKLTSDLMAKMEFGEFEIMVGEYIANFIYPSLTDGE